MSPGSTTNHFLQDWILRKAERPPPALLLGAPNGQDFHIDEAPRTIQLTQEIGLILSVTVQRFVPDPSDTTGYSWKDQGGNDRKMEMPPYYICDMYQALLSMCDYGQRSSQIYIEELLNGANPIMERMFAQAVRFVKDTKVIASPHPPHHVPISLP